MMMYGWNTNPYLGASEFYLNTGILMNITAPANHIVVCSGELVNPAVYLYRAKQTRLAQAKLSDKQCLFVQQKK
jgi:hypothetical protein